MQAIDFNDGWSYRHLDADESFTAVRLPHDATCGDEIVLTATDATNRTATLTVSVA